MNNSINSAALLREARRRADITQRELARRAETAQSVIARIESGKTDPTTATLNRLLAAAGFELQMNLAAQPVENSHMLEDVNRILQLTPEERLQEVRNVNQLQAAAHRA